MGLAPYGKPRYAELIMGKLVKVADDGSFQLNMSYFDYATGLTMTNKKFNALFGGPPRSPEKNLTQRDMDLAASIQKVTEDIVIKLAKGIAKETGERNLCLAGGVALNCVANGILFRKKFSIEYGFSQHQVMLVVHLVQHFQFGIFITIISELFLKIMMP